MKRLIRGASVTLAARGVALVVGLAASIVLARALGPRGRGIYALIVLIPTLLQVAGGLGLEGAVTYLVARRRDDARPLVLTLTLASALLGAALIAVHAALMRAPFYLQFLETSGLEAGLVWILVALVPVTLATLCVTGGLLGLERYRAYNLSTLLTPSINLLMLLGLIIAFRLGVREAVVSLAIAQALGWLGALWLFWAASTGPARVIPGVIGAALRYGIGLHLANVAWFLHYRADMFLVGYLAGPAALGYYAVAVGLAEKLYMPASAVGTVLFPRVAAETGTESPDATPAACRHTLWLTIALSVTLAVVAWPLVYLLYGGDFLPALVPLWLLLPGVVSLSVGRVLSADLNGRGMPATVARANGSMALLNIALNLWWIPIWGAAGAAAATSISYTAAVLILAGHYRHLSGTRWSDLLLLSGADRSFLVRTLTAPFRRRPARGEPTWRPRS